MDFEVSKTAVLAGAIPVIAKKLGTIIYSGSLTNLLQFFGICRYLHLICRLRNIQSRKHGMKQLRGEYNKMGVCCVCTAQLTAILDDRQFQDMIKLWHEMFSIFLTTFCLSGYAESALIIHISLVDPDPGMST